MRLLVDTSVWSLALRRTSARALPLADELRMLIDEGRVAMIGPIRQELLSGVRNAETFERLREHLSAFDDEPLERADYERATEHFNACRGHGIRGSNTDFLICASAERRSMSIFTNDRDFSRFARVLPIQLYGG
ncbi:MAG: type II toxin-antitoxin system VapC family toxin [Vicinamibacterales bacterium]